MTGPAQQLAQKPAEQAGEQPGDWIHRGATSQDILDSAAMLVAQRVSRHVGDQLVTAAGELARIAQVHRNTLMAGRTLTQHAAPTTFGVTVASWLDGVGRAVDAMELLQFPVQLGGSVGNGSAFFALTGRVDALSSLRSATALRLGLSDPGRSWHTERSAVATVAGVLSLVLGTVGRIAADVVVLSRTEVSEVHERAQSGGGTSSAMPHKHNPATAVLLVSAAKRAPGLLATIHAALVAEDQRPAGAWHSEWQALRELMRMATEAADALVTIASRLEVDADRMRTNLELTGGLILSEQVLGQLTAALGRREAASVVAEAIADVEAGTEAGTKTGTQAGTQAGTEAGTDFGAAVRRVLGARGFDVSVDVSPDFVLQLADGIVDAACARHNERIKSIRFAGAGTDLGSPDRAAVDRAAVDRAGTDRAGVEREETS